MKPEQPLRKPDASPYLTAREAVDYLRLRTLSCLYYHIKQNKLPTLRRGSRYLFEKTELAAWLAGTNSIDLWRKRRRYQLVEKS